jgi:hypothetical protein
MITFNADIIAATALAQETFEHTQAIIDGLADGERIQIKDLVAAVSKRGSLPVKDIIGFVSFFAHNTESAYVTRGKNGGLIKGTKVVKPVKVKKPKKTVSASLADDSSASGALSGDREI